VKHPDSRKKLRELVVFLASSSDALRTRSLNVMLYFCDFAAHRALGASITGSVYEHTADGPALRAAASAWKQLYVDGAITLTPTSADGHDRRVVTALRPSDLPAFSAAELALIKFTATKYLSLSADELSAAARREPGWRLTRDGEEIPYRTAWLSADELTEEEINAGREIAEVHGLVERTAL
jgi:hypothetical protein